MPFRECSSSQLRDESSQCCLLSHARHEFARGPDGSVAKRGRAGMARVRKSGDYKQFEQQLCGSLAGFLPLVMPPLERLERCKVKRPSCDTRSPSAAASVSVYCAVGPGTMRCASSLEPGAQQHRLRPRIGHVHFGDMWILRASVAKAKSTHDSGTASLSACEWMLRSLELHGATCPKNCSCSY